MATSILPVGTGVTPSSPITLAVGESMTVVLRGVEVPAGVTVNDLCIIEAQDEASAWWPCGAVERGPAQVFQAVGTFRFRRAAGVTLGLFRA